MNDDKYESIVDEAFSYELKKTEPPTLIQYIRSLRNNEFRKDELNRIFSKGPVIRDPETEEPYTNPLKVLSDGFDYVNDQVSLKKLSPMLKFLPEDNTPSVLKDVADYSLKDFQYDVIGEVEEKVSGLTDNQLLGGIAAFGVATQIPDATDFLTGGIPVADTLRFAKRIPFKKLDEIFTNILSGPNPKFATDAGGVNPNTFFMSKSDDATGGRIVWPTPKQIYDTKQELMKNKLADASGKLNIWNYFDNKKGRSDWGRLMAKKYQTLPHTRSSWKTIKDELQADFLSIYPEKFLKTIKYKNAKGNWVALGKDSIEVEHIFTLQQSMPIFADVEWGGELWQQIARQILSRQFALGDTRQNLVAVPEHIHRIKTQYFNKMAGIDGRKFFTDDVINRMIADPKFRTDKIDEWLDEVEKGKKIIDDGLTIWKTLYKGEEIPIMPEELVEKLANIDLDTADIKKVIPQIFAEFEAEGFTTDTWNVKELKALQLKKDAADVEATGKIISKYIKSNPKKYNKPYPFGMRDQDLRDAAENAWVWMRKNKLKFEGPIQQSLFDAEDKEKWIKFTMKSILNQSRRNFK